MIKVVIAAHKKYRMPEDDMYIPLHVGADCKLDSKGNPLDLGFIKDNTGENISHLNPGFCELTGLYWAWKNLNCEYIGLVHYRRHFSLKKKGKDPFDNILMCQEIEPFLGRKKVFVPSKRHYYIETLYSHYAHTHYAVHLDETRQIIAEKYPEYLACLDKVFSEKKGYMFNMMIMTSSLIDDYCNWLFDILFELKDRVDTSDLSAFQQRFYGRVSEILFNAWLMYKLKNGTIASEEIMEIPCIFMEKVNWWKKGHAFLAAKFANKKYDGSF